MYVGDENEDDIGYDDLAYDEHDDPEIMTLHADAEEAKGLEDYDDNDNNDDYADDEDALIHLGNNEEDLDYDSAGENESD